MKRILCITPVILFLTVCLNGQQFYPLDQPVLPPSPSSTSVMKFSAIPPGLSSGIIPVNIPLLTLPGRSLSASVGLSYHASGVKVAETPGPVGSNWGLITGGLITRTMYNRPDEMSEGYLKWKQLAGDSWSFGSDTIENFAKGSWDSQPDVFNYMFPGHSGKFVFGLDENGDETIYTIPRNLMKIEWNDSDTIIEEFTITTDGGVKYFFGKSLTGNREAIESASCDPFFTGGTSFNYNSAWYLLQVVSPIVIDTINYYYSTCNEHVDYKYAEAHYYPVWTYPSDPSVSAQSEEYSEKISYSVPILDSITTDAGKIACYHSGNRLDIPSGRKIDSLGLFNYYGDKIRSYHLDYSHFSCGSDSLEKRLVLDGLTEFGSDGSAKPGYTFTYQNGNLLPGRDSDKQDYWGYYNNNTQSYFYSGYWDQVGASRITDTARVKYGLLNEIEFPAGASKVFDYESNFISKKRNRAIISESDHFIYDNVDISWSGVDGRTPDTIKFFLPVSQTIDISYTLSGISSNTKFLGALEILSDSTDWVKGTNQVYESGNESKRFSGEECTIVLRSYDPAQSANINFWYKRYFDFVSPYSTTDAFVGGARVKKVVLQDGISSSNNIETCFTYLDSIASDTSSGVLTDFLPNHHYEYRYDNGTSNSCYFVRYARLNSLLFDRGYHLGYSAHQTSAGDNSGTTMVSTVSPSEQINESTERFPFSYPSSAGWKRGQVSGSFTYDSDNSLRTENYQTFAIYDDYGDENRTVIKGLKASLKSSEGAFDKDSIRHISSWSHPVYQKNVSYPVDGGNPISSEQRFFYDNPDHMKLTRISKKGSDQDSTVTRITYPMDYNSGTGGSRDAAITLMRGTANMNGVPIENFSVKNDELISATCRTFKVINGVIIPDTSYTYDLEEPLAYASFDSSYSYYGYFHMDNNYRPLNAIVEIDSYNRVQEAHAVHGNSSVNLHGYNGLYPIASISNASLDEVGYSSFECEQKGSLSYTDSYISEDTCAITGEKLLTGGSLSKSNLPSGEYFLTFWANSAPSVLPVTATMIDNGSVNRQGMRFYQYKVVSNGSTEISISSISKIDEVRIFPVGSLVTTRTYIPLVGISSQAGVNSIPSYTSYDSFGRPEKVKNQDKYIIQEYEYNYANQ